MISTWPQFADDEIQAVERVLRSGKVNYWTGDECKQFEREYSDHCGTSYGIALANGSVGLELALYSIGIGSGDDVIVPARTFQATGSSVVLRGGTPVFADVDSDSQNVTADTLAAALTPRTRAIIVVHLAGWPCDMDPIVSFARDNDLRIIEDCAQAHGARDRGRPVGGIGDAGVFSFCQDKIITTAGEGGMLVTSDRGLWEKAWSYKDHGKSYELTHEPPPSAKPGFRWLHEGFGTNWRMTECQAAIGRVQLGKLETWTRTRRRNAAVLEELLGASPLLRIPVPADDSHHSYYKFYAFVRPERLQSNWSRDRLVDELNNIGIQCFTGSCPEIYREAAFRNAGMSPPERLAVSRLLGDTSLMFPVDPTISEQAVRESSKAILQVLRAAALPEQRYGAGS